MKIHTGLSITALALSAALLAGCGQSGGVSGRDQNRFVQACLEQTNMERPLCECIANLAADELTPGGFAMLLASIEENDARSAQLRSQLTMEELTQSGMFMVSAPGRCASNTN